jgi:hypothetical protein
MVISKLTSQPILGLDERSIFMPVKLIEEKEVRWSALEDDFRTFLLRPDVFQTENAAPV